MAIFVIVAEGGTGAPPSGISHTSFSRDVGESAVAIIVIERCAIEIRNIKVFPAIVVVVSDGDAESPSAMSQPRFHRHIGESAIVVIVVELAGMALLCL